MATAVPTWPHNATATVVPAWPYGATATAVPTWPYSPTDIEWVSLCRRLPSLGRTSRSPRTEVAILCRRASNAQRAASLTTAAFSEVRLSLPSSAKKSRQPPPGNNLYKSLSSMHLQRTPYSRKCCCKSLSGASQYLRPRLSVRAPSIKERTEGACYVLDQSPVSHKAQRHSTSRAGSSPHRADLLSSIGLARRNLSSTDRLATLGEC